MKRTLIYSTVHTVHASKCSVCKVKSPCYGVRLHTILTFSFSGDHHVFGEQILKGTFSFEGNDWGGESTLMSSLNIELESAGSNDCSGLRLHSKKNMVHGVLNSQLSTPTTKGKGRSGEDLFCWVSTFVFCLLISKTGFYVNTSTEKGEGRCKSWFYVSE